MDPPLRPVIVRPVTTQVVATAPGTHRCVGNQSVTVQVLPKYTATNATNPRASAPTRVQVSLLLLNALAMSRVH